MDQITRLDRQAAIEHLEKVGITTDRIRLTSFDDSQFAEFVSELFISPARTFYRLAWREMIPDNGERSLFAAILPPGPIHVHSVRTLAMPSRRETALQAGFWASIVLDFYLRASGRGHLDVGDARTMPRALPDHPLAEPLLLRTLRLNCVTAAYKDLWENQYSSSWCDEGWACQWTCCPPLETTSNIWDLAVPLRTEAARRAALVEIDALVAVWLGISADSLSSVLQSRYSVLLNYEADTYFDRTGKKIAKRFETFGSEQARTDRGKTYAALSDHLADPATASPPTGYAPPFVRASRIDEMIAAHAVFQARLDAAVERGEWSSDR